MVGHHQANNVRTVLFDGHGVCLDGHIRRYGGDARGHDTPSLFIFHQAEPARASRHQVRMMAECGYLYPIFCGYIQYTGA